MPDKKYIIQREGRWYYSRRLPKHLFGCISDPRITNSNLIRYSLDTHDYKIAVQKRNIENVKWDAIFHAAEAGEPLSLTPNQAVRLVQEYVERTDKEWRKQHSIDGPKTEEQRKELQIDTGISEQVLTDIDDPRGSESVYQSISKLLKQGNFEITNDGIPLETFGEWYRRP